ncbi:hypothetical protein AbraCBS73388_009010 [Aspergillus brasiliensis]|uniref:Epoxide hydrolase N-terminal domain-containing protein n=1 Tax=Aspergillus brasiliensis TaxID=319629 RepID=A0A9W5YSM6_9EURO|nr:hypothetical protein AbraCBS73388_009010 [Aspergillus brasiliensis]
MAEVRPFTVNIPESLLQEVHAKLKLARLDESMGEVEWNDLEIGHTKFKQLVEFWRDEYDWRKFESFLDTFYHFKTPIQVPGFEPLDIHFLHHRSSQADAIPLLFVHGWPGSFLESLKIIPLLTEPPDGRQAFHVVAPSLPGYGFSDFPRKSGFGLERYADCFARLMATLGYDKFVCQGGDWGSSIVRYMALGHPDKVLGIHINMFLALPPSPESSVEKFQRYQNMDYSTQELKNLEERTRWFANNEVSKANKISPYTLRGYQRVQETKNVTLGYALHDSPVGMLAWLVGKLKAWTDDYPWTKEEIIHWTFIHYQGSPSAAMQIYKEAEAVLNEDKNSMLGRYISQPVGCSVFPKELWLSPRDWMSETCNIQFWKEHKSGGHFIAWERPEALAADVAEFFDKKGPVFKDHRGH